jgi:heme exporter protein C
MSRSGKEGSMSDRSPARTDEELRSGVVSGEGHDTVSVSLLDKLWLVRGLGLAAFLTLLAALYVALFVAPTERVMGEAQRIFYFHVPSAWVAFLAFFVVCVASILYLWKRERKWDILALSSAELGVLFATLVLLTGPIWARSVWGIWWTWDARLTATLVLWLIYVGYLMLRAYVEEGARRARLAAVLGIVGAVDIPIIVLSVQWWRTQHPSLILLEQGSLEPGMVQALLLALLAFSLLYAYLLVRRIRLEATRDYLEAIKATLTIGEGQEWSI